LSYKLKKIISPPSSPTVPIATLYAGEKINLEDEVEGEMIKIHNIYPCYITKAGLTKISIMTKFTFKNSTIKPGLLCVDLAEVVPTKTKYTFPKHLLT